MSDTKPQAWCPSRPGVCLRLKGAQDALADVMRENRENADRAAQTEKALDLLLRLSSTGRIPRAAAGNEEDLEAEIQRRKEKLLAQAKAALGMQ